MLTAVAIRFDGSEGGINSINPDAKFEYALSVLLASIARTR